MPDRFVVPAPLEPGLLRLADSEAQHMARVLRKQVGDEVELFDGAGRVATARIVEISKRHTDLDVADIHEENEPSAPRIRLLVAAPKGDRFRWLVEKVTELGIDELCPIRTQRTVVDPGSTKLHKLEQTSIAACKQCGRNRFLRIVEPQDFDAALAAAIAAGETLVYGGIGGPSLADWRRQSPALPDTITLVVGPEGGFTPQEFDALTQANATPVTIGPHTLRTETAAIALSAALVSLR